MQSVMSHAKRIIIPGGSYHASPLSIGRGTKNLQVEVFFPFYFFPDDEEEVLLAITGLERKLYIETNSSMRHFPAKLDVRILLPTHQLPKGT